MKKNTFLGIVGMLVGLAGCEASSDEACNPSGAWTFTTSPAAGDTCGIPTETGTEFVSVSNGNASLTDPDGSTHQGPLDSACHTAYTSQVSTAELNASGSTEWTFTGTKLYGSSNATVTFADGSSCTVKQATFGARQ